MASCEGLVQTSDAWYFTKGQVRKREFGNTFARHGSWLVVMSPIDPTLHRRISVDDSCVSTRRPMPG